MSESHHPNQFVDRNYTTTKAGNNSDSLTSLSTRAIHALRRVGIRDARQLLSMAVFDISWVADAGINITSEIARFMQSNCMSEGPSKSSSFCSDPDISLTYTPEHVFRSAFAALSVRSRNVLVRRGITDARTLCMLSANDLLSFQNLGVKSVREIVELQAEFKGSVLDDPRSCPVEAGFSDTHTSTDRSLLGGGERVALATSCEVTTDHSAQLAAYSSLVELRDDDGLLAFDVVISTLPDKISSLVNATNIQELVEWLQRADSTQHSTEAIRTRLSIVKDTVSERRFDCEAAAQMLFKECGNVVDPDLWKSPVLTGRIGRRMCRILAPRPRMFKALMGGFGLLESNSTLDAFGKSIGVSRERARQLHGKAMDAVRVYPGLIRWVMDVVSGVLHEFGGQMSAEDLEFELLGRNSSVKRKGLPPFIVFLSSSTDWETSGLTLDGEMVTLRDGRNDTFELITTVVYDAAIRAANQNFGPNLWSAPFQEVVNAISQSVRDHYSHDLRLSHALIRRAIETRSDLIKIEGSCVYSLRYWQLCFGTVPERVEAVCLQAGRPMHYKDIYAEVKRWNGMGRSFNPRGGIERSANLLLWDRGTYVHRLCVQLPYELLRAIEEWLDGKLNDAVPYVSIAGAHAAFVSECMSAGIPSRHALYGALRHTSSNLLEFSEYPYVRRRSATGQRLPVPIVAEGFIQQVGGFVTRSEINHFLERDLGVNVALVALHLGNTPNVLFGRSNLIHVDNLQLDAEAVRELVDYCECELLTHTQISVGAVVKSRRILSVRIGIDDSRLLHSVIVHFSQGRLAGEFPHIVRYGNKGAITSIANVGSDFVRAYGEPCSFQALTQYLVEQRGYDPRHAAMVMYHESIVRFSVSTIVHLDVIGWDPDKQMALRELAQRTYNSARDRGELWGRISSVLEQYEVQLPELESSVWTETLLASLVKRDSYWLLLGNAKDAFVPRDNADGIDQLDRAIELVLERDHVGATERDSFECELRETGLIQSKLTQSMLGKSSRVVINDSDVLLRRLIDAR